MSNASVIGMVGSGGLPSETLKLRIIRGRGIKGWCWRGCFKGINAVDRHENVPLQVFSGETTPILTLDLCS